MIILNEQKPKWFDKVKLFYLFKGNIMYECNKAFSRSLEDVWYSIPDKVIEQYGKPIGRYIVKKK